MTAAIRPGDRLAVYGSLMRQMPVPTRLAGGPNLRGRAIFEGPCLLPGRLYDLGDYPGLRPHATSRVRGELYRVLSPSLSVALDAWELYDPRDIPGSLYQRVRMPLLSPGVTVWAYVYQGPATSTAPSLVPGGDWRRHLAHKRRSAIEVAMV